MDITGKIIFVSERRSGTSRAGNPWMRQDFVIETHEQYPKKCAFSVLGQERLDQMNLQLNGEYTVSLDVDAHEFNGRWYTDLRAWRAVPAQAGAGAPQAAQYGSSAPQQPSQAAEDDFAAQPSDSTDDLPF